MLLLLGELTAVPLLKLLGTKEELIDGATIYLRIYFLGMPAMALYNFGNAVLSAAGDTRRPLLYLLIAGILNVALNLFFVIVCKLDVAGVAIATVISQCISASLVLRCMVKDTGPLHLDLKKMRLHPQAMRQILRIGLPAGLQSAVFAISNIVIQSAINSLGKVVMAASSAAYNIEVFAYDVMNSYNQACTTFVGQNYGAGQIRRCRKTLYLCLIEDAVSLGATVALVLLTGRFLLSIFNNDPQVVALGYDRLKIVFFAYIFSLLYEVMSGYLRGFGISLVPAALTALGVCGIRIAWIHFAFPQHPTLQTIMTSYPVSLSATALMIFIALLCYRPARKHAAMEREPAPAGN